MTPLVFIDTETTGLDPTRRRPWEIALIRRDESSHETERAYQVRDVALSDADPSSLKFGRFYERHLQYGPPVMAEEDPRAAIIAADEATVAAWVEKFTRGAHLVGVNPSFDAITLEAMLRRHGLIPAWHYHVLDVSAMAMGWLNGRAVENPREAADWPMTPPWKSDDLAARCGVEPPADDERHTAMGDARWAMRWYDAMTGGAS